MDFLQVLVLSLVQGLTEFLPISSSAHLILVPVFTSWEDQGLAFDVAVHLGTLLAVGVYFRQELRQMLISWLDSLLGRGSGPESRLAWAVLLGTIPLGLVGFLLADFVGLHLRSPEVIATATIFFGILLWWADICGHRRRDEYELTWKDVVVIGCAQAIALIPGTSRSGITITAGLAMGLTRQAAARFSFLLSIPGILLAGGYLALKLVNQSGHIEWWVLFCGVMFSGISAWLCIHFFLKILDHSGMLMFVLYRLVLGAILLIVFL